MSRPATPRRHLDRPNRLVARDDADWPRGLATHLPDLEGLAVRGDLPPRDRPTVAIVGQRRATEYGREVTAWLADAMARAGVVVVSGGAMGIDAAAHGAAADAGGRTVVVLGCGIDVPYPAVHARQDGLFDRAVAAGGAVVSQWSSGERPSARLVLARNRTVAAWSDAVVVVEGGARSGTLNTASHAADLGIPVLAVPGDVRAPGSAAPLQLLAEGCAPCRGPDDVLATIGARLDLLASPPAAAVDEAVLPAPIAGLLADAYPRAVTLDALVHGSGLGTGRVMATLTRARIAGLVTTESGGARLRRAPG